MVQNIQNEDRESKALSRIPIDLGEGAEKLHSESVELGDELSLESLEVLEDDSSFVDESQLLLLLEATNRIHWNVCEKILKNCSSRN